MLSANSQEATGERKLTPPEPFSYVYAFQLDNFKKKIQNFTKTKWHVATVS